MYSIWGRCDVFGLMSTAAIHSQLGVLKAAETMSLKPGFYLRFVRHANGRGNVGETSVYYGIILYLAQLSNIHCLVHRISLHPSTSTPTFQPTYAYQSISYLQKHTSPHALKIPPSIMLQAPSTRKYANAHTHSIRQIRSLAQPCVKQKMLLQRKPKTCVKLRGIGYFLPTAKTPDGKSNKSKLWI